ncbi:MAG: hypothetical protein HY751_04790 [Nitrospinae bacterium]|nr:hypothetical protein [Nitrospinota bacterium]
MAAGINSNLTYQGTPVGINITDLSGKSPHVPMAGKGAPVKISKRQTGNAQIAALQQSARAALPPAPPGGKVNIMA